MSSDFPEQPSAHQPWNAGPVSPALPFQDAGPSKREWILASVLLCFTLVSTTFAGLSLQVGFDIILAFQLFIRQPSLIFQGLPFSIPLLSILMAHELGHFAACRYYGMRCTPPFFLPVPISIAGTFGAFIKIKSQFLNRKALFDVGIAGPFAGFLFILPTLWIGISLSKLVPRGIIHAGDYAFGEPLIFRWFGMLILGYSPQVQDMTVHPMAMAAWVGLLATSLNLLPVWQLDGGHISYAVLGRSLQRNISIFSLLVLIFTSLVHWRSSVPILFFAAMLLVIGVRLRFFHPPPIYQEEELGMGRVILAILALLILILSFTPVPVTI